VATPLVAFGVCTVAPSALGAVSESDSSPVVVTASKPDTATGSVRVSLALRDGRTASFQLPAKTAKGTLTRRSPTGVSFTYRPTPAARHLAARDGATPAEQRDSFAVTVSDGHGGTVSVPISLRVSPQNTAPVAAPVVNPADGNGVVTGSIGARDADGDTLSYRVTTPPSLGNVTVSPSGDFTYTPTARSGHRRGAMQASTDAFTATVTDGYGGSTPVSLVCPSAPAPGIPPFPPFGPIY
jgi:VCBS repeat-containing protein